MSARKSGRLRLVAVVVLAASLLAVDFAAPASAQSAEDVGSRNQLIANQENLLNTYRCSFGVDLSVVPGGCSNRRIVQPGTPPLNPTQADIEARETLIRNQENLLNIYRCRFQIDTQVVPGGCVDGKPAGPEPEEPEPTLEPEEPEEPEPTPEPEEEPEHPGHPDSISGWVLDFGDDDDGKWWSYDVYADPDNPDTSPGFAAGCANDNSLFYLVVWSDTPVARSADERVAVSISLGDASGEARWRAADDDEEMYLAPPDGLVSEILDTGSTTLGLTITDEDGQTQSFSVDLAGFSQVIFFMSELCPVPLGWQPFGDPNGEGANWGYVNSGMRSDGAVGYNQQLYAVCHADNTAFTFFVYSDATVRRSDDDQSVTVTHQLGNGIGSMGEARWWASDDDNPVRIHPPSWLVAELASAGPVPLSLEITDADGRSQNFVFDLTGFAEAIEQMSEQCPIPSTGVSDGAITVPAEPPSGRCASTVTSGTYRWEQCAWAEYWQDPVFNRPLSDGEARTLISRIWAEVDVEGKPSLAPTSNLVPAGSECAHASPGGGFIIGCYLPGQHHIRRLDAFTETLLHEVAHALLVNHPTVQSCGGITDFDAYQACAHNDIFRCVADHLYTTYAGIPSAGVCGTTPDRGQTNTQETGWETFDLDSGPVAVVGASWHTRPSPYEDSTVSLAVRCSQSENELDVFFFFDEGTLAAGSSGGISAAHLFLPKEFNEWGADEQSEYVDNNRLDADWIASLNSRAGFLPNYLHEDFVNDAVDYDEVLISAWNPDGSEFGIMSFSLEGSYTHIRTVTETCGWTWS